MWSGGGEKSVEYLILFLTGGLFWIAFYNISNKSKLYFDKIFILVALLFGTLFFYYYLTGKQQVLPWSLHMSYNTDFNHFHIGDLWAALLPAILFMFYATKRKYYIPLILFGTLLIAMSLSRSAYISLIAGALFLFHKSDVIQGRKLIFRFVTIIALVMIVIAGIYKPTILSRPYFIQAIVGHINNPFGVGMGNFSVISSNPANHLWGLSNYSMIVHNLLLEVISGIGIFGYLFIYWFGVIIYDIWKHTIKDNIVYSTVFLSLTINFMFDSTYFVPTMLWLWFMSLGLAQASINTNETTKKISA